MRLRLTHTHTDIEAVTLQIKITVKLLGLHHSIKIKTFIYKLWVCPKSFDKLAELNNGDQQWILYKFVINVTLIKIFYWCILRCVACRSLRTNGSFVWVCSYTDLEEFAHVNVSSFEPVRQSTHVSAWSNLQSYCINLKKVYSQYRLVIKINQRWLFAIAFNLQTSMILRVIKL